MDVQGEPDGMALTPIMPQAVCHACEAPADPYGPNGQTEMRSCPNRATLPHSSRTREAATLLKETDAKLTTMTATWRRRITGIHCAGED